MAQKVTIDVEARFTDHVSSGAKTATESLSKVENEAKDAAKAIDNVGKKKVQPKVDADTTQATQKVSKVDRLLNKLRNSRTETKLTAVDKASQLISKVASKAQAFANKTYSAVLKVRDSNVLSTLNKASTGLRNLTSKAWSIAIKVPSTIFAPLTMLKNTLFNIKTLIGGVATAWAASKLFGGAISVADAYSSAKISFSTLLGEKRGQQMMDDLDEFAKSTPFNTTNVIDNANKMLAMGWDAENIITDMEIIGNAAAATGKMDQGLESIVRALSQIKTKGRLSTEELNQLAEAGIAAKAMLAEQLGYGTGDAGIAAMTEDLEDGLIASDIALEALLAGMKKYDGMMDSMANETVEGLISQMQDAFEINIVRKWGQGLQDGAKRGLGTVVDMLDDAEAALESLGDTMYTMGRTISNWAADRLENAVERIMDITGSSEFKNANLKEKISMLWNGVVADPLKEWWENGGQAKTAETAGEIGGWMGRTITAGLLEFFGMTEILDPETAQKLGEDGGMSVAQSFAKGFTDNFDGEAITTAIVDAIGNVWDALPWWAKGLLGITGGGMAAGGITKVAGGIASTVSGVAGAVGGFSIANSAFPILTGAGTGALGALGKAGVSLGASTTGAAVATGAAGIAGGLAGGAAAIKGGIDLYRGYTTDDAVEAKARKRSGWTTLGGLGAGAAAGAAIGSIVPGLGTALGALVGGGIGGIGGWLGGNAWANKIRDVETTVGVNITGEKHIQNTIEVLAEDFGIPEEHADTVALLLTGDKELLNKIDVSKLAEEFGIPESQAKTIIEELTAAKSIENRLEVLASDFGVPDSISKTISVNITAIAGKIKNFVGNIFGGDSDSGKDAGYRGGIFGGDSAMDAFARGGIVGGSTRFIRVNEEAPEMIIPLSSQRRDRAQKLWAKTGELLNVPGFFRGGRTTGGADEGIRFQQYGSGDAHSGQTVQIDVGGITVEINVETTGDESIVEAIRRQKDEIAEEIAGIMADAFSGQFENTPLRGGAV